MLHNWAEKELLILHIKRGLWAAFRWQCFRVCVCVCVCVYMLSCVWLFATPRTVPCQAPLSMGFPRQEHWGGLPCPPPEHPPGPGVKPKSLTSLALTGRFFTTRATWEPQSFHSCSSDHRGRKYPPKMVTKEVVSFPSGEFFFLLKKDVWPHSSPFTKDVLGTSCFTFCPFT